MAESVALALIFSSPLVIPAMWFAHFILDPWPEHVSPRFIPFLLCLEMCSVQGDESR